MYRPQIAKSDLPIKSSVQFTSQIAKSDLGSVRICVCMIYPPPPKLPSPILGLSNLVSVVYDLPPTPPPKKNQQVQFTLK